MDIEEAAVRIEGKIVELWKAGAEGGMDQWEGDRTQTVWKDAALHQRNETPDALQAVAVLRRWLKQPAGPIGLKLKRNGAVEKYYNKRDLS